ncbi:response regulator transcription factor [Rhodovulum sp. DZ06]|uniref:helix-turn-helix transcriptional regulator n=1 Tax=Rhodovulum sp. DZ06 TaxID=3425126 RepID=UPI003D33FAD7
MSAATPAFQAGADRFLRRLDAATAPEQVWDAALEAFGSFGPGWLGFSVVDAARDALLGWRSAIPPAVDAAYAEQKMLRYDYCLAHALASRTLLSWAIPADGRSSAAGEGARRFDAFLAAHGRRHVLVQPFHETHRRIGVALLLAEPWTAGEEGLSRFRFFANLLRAHYRWEGDPNAAPTSGPLAARALLTPREREALRRIADGRTAVEAAAAMGVSAAALRKHIASARAKLGAATREEAVAVAHRLGLMQPLAGGAAPGAAPGAARPRGEGA